MIINLTCELSKHVPVVVIARTGGVVEQELSRVGAQYVQIEPQDASLPAKIDGDDLLVDFGTYREHCRLARVNPRFLLWRIFPNVQCPSRLGKLLCKWTFQRLDRQDALYFMDNECHATASQELGHDFTRRILPVPIPVGDRRYRAAAASGVVNITYIGRGGRIWKVKPLKKLAQDLSRIGGMSFHLHVFTDTDELYAKELGPWLGPGLKTSYYFGYTGDRLSQKLLELSDLHYSMGTACLEGAALGIPTILADAAYEDFPEDYRYRWLVDDPENYAGQFVRPEQLKPGRTVLDMVTMTACQEAREALSKATYEVACRYSCTTIAQDLLHARSLARLRDGLRLMPRYWRGVMTGRK